MMKYTMATRCIESVEMDNLVKFSNFHSNWELCFLLSNANV